LSSLLSDGGSLLSGFANTCDILSLLSEGRYFRGGRYFRNFTVIQQGIEQRRKRTPPPRRRSRPLRIFRNIEKSETQLCNIGMEYNELRSKMPRIYRIENIDFMYFSMFMTLGFICTWFWWWRMIYHKSFVTIIGPSVVVGCYLQITVI